MFKAENNHIGIKKRRHFSGIHKIFIFALLFEIMWLVGFCNWNYGCHFTIKTDVVFLLSKSHFHFPTKFFVDIWLSIIFIHYTTKTVVCFWFSFQRIYFLINLTILLICRKMTLEFSKHQIMICVFQIFQYSFNVNNGKSRERKR